MQQSGLKKRGNSSDIELVNEQWLVAKSLNVIKKRLAMELIFILPHFLDKTNVINEKPPPTRWSLVLEPIKIIIRSSSPERLLSQTAQGEEGITRTPCVFLNRPVCVSVCHSAGKCPIRRIWRSAGTPGGAERTVSGDEGRERNTVAQV